MLLSIVTSFQRTTFLVILFINHYDSTMSTVSAQTGTSTAEVNTSTQPAAATNVVDNNTNSRSAFRRRGNPRPKTYNEAGVQTVKGGSEIGAGFFDAVTSAYTNLVNKPIALILIIVATLGLLSLNHGTLTPLDTMYNSALNKSNTADTPNGVRSIAAGFAWILSLVIEYQNLLLPGIFFGGIYISKPSENNAWLCASLTVITWLSRFNHLELVALGHLTILFTQVREPIYRLSILLFAVVTVIIGFTHMSGYVGLSKLTAVASPSGNSTPLPPVEEMPPIEEV